MNQKGVSQILILLGFLILVLVIGGAYYINQQQNKQLPSPSFNNNSQPIPTSVYNTETQGEILDKSISPDNSFTVIKRRLADQLKLTIQNKNGNVVTENMISLNDEVIKNNLERLGLKGSGMIGYSVKNWVNNSTFVLQISPANGEEYEATVDAITGKINESSFKKIK